MQKSKKFLHSFLMFILFSALGTAIGFGIGRLLLNPLNQGAFVSWKLLDSPHKFTKIVDANSRVVWVQSEDGYIYFRDVNCFPSSNCNYWVETPSVNNNMERMWELPMEKRGFCKENGDKYPEDPSGNVAECAIVRVYGAEFGETVYFALLENGSMLMWKHSSSMILNIVIQLFFSFLGSIIGIIAFVIFIRRRRKNII